MPPPRSEDEGLLESLCEASGAGLWAPDCGKQDRALQRAAVGVQARGAAHPRLLPEYKEIIRVLEHVGTPALQEGAELIKTLDWEGRVLPAGLKVLRRVEPVTGVLGKWELGVPWSPASFLAASNVLVHPFDANQAAADDQIKAVFWQVTHGHAEVEAHRNHTLDQLEEFIKFHREEERIHHQLEQGVARIVW